MSFTEEKHPKMDTEVPVFDPSKQYTPKELDFFADQVLREDAKSLNPETGKARGIGGKDPILFAEHEKARKKREIYCENGVPDPGLVLGIFFRTHPQGRKVNSDEQRQRNGAGFYRS